MTQQEYELCRDIGMRTAQNESYYTKRVQTINIFWGLEGLKAFIIGYQIEKAFKDNFKSLEGGAK